MTSIIKHCERNTNYGKNSLLVFKILHLLHDCGRPVKCIQFNRKIQNTCLANIIRIIHLVPVWHQLTNTLDIIYGHEHEQSPLLYTRMLLHFYSRYPHPHQCHHPDEPDSLHHHHYSNNFRITWTRWTWQNQNTMNVWCQNKLFVR